MSNGGCCDGGCSGLDFLSRPWTTGYSFIFWIRLHGIDIGLRRTDHENNTSWEQQMFLSNVACERKNYKLDPSSGTDYWVAIKFSKEKSMSIGRWSRVSERQIVVWKCRFITWHPWLWRQLALEGGRGSIADRPLATRRPADPQTTEYRPQSTDHRAQTTEHQVRIAEGRIQEYRLHDAESRYYIFNIIAEKQISENLNTDYTNHTCTTVLEQAAQR